MRRPKLAYLSILYAVLLGAIALSLASAPAPVMADEFNDLEDEYESASRLGARTKMKRIVGRIADLNTEDAASFLLEKLEDDQKARKRPRHSPKRLPGDVRDAIVEALSRFTEEKSVGLIGKMALELKSDREPRLALDQFDYFKALAGMSDVEPADKTLRLALAHESNPYIKVAALEAIRQQRARRFAEEVADILREENKAWGNKWVIVPINTLACLEDIVEPGDTEIVIKVVESVIKWEERKHCDSERVRFFGSRMLHRLTDEAARMDSVHFWKWWVAQMKTSGAADRSDRPDEGRSKTAVKPPPVVFDTAPVGRRFVFVIDVSDSMKDPLKITLKEIEDRKKKRRGPITGKSGDEEKEEEEEKEDDNPLRRLPWKEITKKIHLAREELARAILSFEGDREFAIVIYSTKVNVITGGWVEATARNCKKWAAEAKELEPQDMTNIHGALTQALKIHDGGTTCDHPSVNEDCVLTGADTIVFLTDGWASWDDQSQRRVTDKRNKEPNAVGDGPFIYGEDIWPDVVRKNLFRKVIINTVGIGNHDKKLLRNLARRTGGTYVDWGFPED